MTKMPKADLLNDRLMRGVAYIEDHLDEPLALSQVARASALSDYHFHRLFRARFGIPVMEYVRRRRLSRAAERLLAGDTRVLDIALEAGFESQQAFTRAFRRIYQLSPAAYRRRGQRQPWHSVGKLADDVVQSLQMETAMEPKIVHLDRFWVAGLATTFTAETRPELPQLWDAFAPKMDKVSGRVGAHFYGVCYAAQDPEEGEFGYMAAVEVDNPAKVEDGYETKEIPAGDYLLFTYQGPISQITRTIDYLWGTWLPQSAYKLRKAPDLERYDERASPSFPMSVVELLIPIEQ